MIDGSLVTPMLLAAGAAIAKDGRCRNETLFVRRGRPSLLLMWLFVDRDVTKAPLALAIGKLGRAIGADEMFTVLDMYVSSRPASDPSGPRPADDPAAIEALVLDHVDSRGRREALMFPYGRDDEGRVQWGPMEAGMQRGRVFDGLTSGFRAAKRTNVMPEKVALMAVVRLGGGSVLALPHDDRASALLASVGGP